MPKSSSSAIFCSDIQNYIQQSLLLLFHIFSSNLARQYESNINKINGIKVINKSKHNMLNQIQEPNQTPAYLLSSSHLFNQKRIQLAKQRQAVESQRKHRMFDGLKEDVSNDINFQSKSDKKQGQRMEGQIGDVFKKEQDLIGKLIGELGSLKSQLAKCKRSYKKMGEPDISKEDEAFVLKLLHKHNYITKQQTKCKISEIFPILKQKHLERVGSGQSCLNQQSQKSMQPPQQQQQKQQTSQQLPLLQNLRPSRYPLLNQLCSIAHGTIKNSKIEKSLVPFELEKKHKFQNQCSLQFDLDLRSAHNQDPVQQIAVYQMGVEGKAKDKGKGKEEEYYQGNNYKKKGSKRYETEGSIGEDVGQEDCVCREGTECNCGCKKQSIYEIVATQNKENQMETSNMQKSHRSEASPFPEYNQLQLQKMLAKISQPSPKSTNKKPRVEPLTPRYHPGQQNSTSPPSSLSSLRANGSNRIKLQIEKVTNRKIIGKLGNMECEVYYNSVEKVVLKDGGLFVEVTGIGEIMLEGDGALVFLAVIAARK